jgi:hypothetical protein
MREIRTRSLAALASLLLGALLHFGAAQAQVSADLGDVATEVKAAYLYKFGNYVDWPALSFESAGSPIRIGVAGEPRLADILSRMVAGRTINGREMEVRFLQPGDQVTGLHILFIGNLSVARRAEIFSAAAGQPILTVSDSQETFEMGSMINFVVVDGRLRFDIAHRPKETEGLRISARLLATARKVVPGPS